LDLVLDRVIKLVNLISNNNIEKGHFIENLAEEIFYVFKIAFHGQNFIDGVLSMDQFHP
jgi:hypothetical protein